MSNNVKYYLKDISLTYYIISLFNVIKSQSPIGLNVCNGSAGWISILQQNFLKVLK